MTVFGWLLFMVGLMILISVVGDDWPDGMA